MNLNQFNSQHILNIIPAVVNKLLSHNLNCLRICLGSKFVKHNTHTHIVHINTAYTHTHTLAQYTLIHMKLARPQKLVMLVMC